MLTLQDLNISKHKQAILQDMDIDSVVGLLTHYPFRYEINTQIPYADWQIGEKVSFEAELLSAFKTNFFGRYQSRTTFEASYDEALIQVTIFNRHYLKKPDHTDRVTVIGKYEGNDKVTALSVNFKPIAEQLGIHPVYNTKSGLSQKDIQTYMKRALAGMKDKIIDVIPVSLREKYQMIDKATAMQFIHFPNSNDDLKQGLRHLKYEEFLKFHLVMQSIKQESTQVITGKQKHFDRSMVNQKIAQLPYALTQGQSKALEEILSDLSSDTLMYRLLQGDVGCGKTIVAGLAMYATVLAGEQACIMAPTEILAKQHVITLHELFPEVQIQLLCAGMKSSDKKEALQNIANHKAQMIVGTHALFQEAVHYPKLGLVIADEQHRFGVEQRRRLKDKGHLADFLLMSATPIPRTLAMSLYGDMNVSTIPELPKGRQPVITKVIQENTMQSILDQVMDLLSDHQQCYVICPMIAESEVMDLKHAQGIYHAMKKVLGKRFRVGLLHGKMNNEDKEDIMHQFASQQIDILVSTTVVEVGVNVPTANIMVIYDANRFGLSQLHQLRGRVGRGKDQGYCFLLCKPTNKEAIDRLLVLEQTTDGFEIAKEDLKLRGPGEILGKKQSGVSGFVLGDIMIDHKMLEYARQDAIAILKDFQNPENQSIRTWLQLKKSENITYID